MEQEDTGMKRVIESMTEQEREMCRAHWEAATKNATASEEDRTYATKIIALLDAI